MCFCCAEYFKEFEGAGHFAWTDFRKDYQEEISQYTVEFLNRYLRNSSDLVLTPGSELLSECRVKKPKDLVH